MTIGIDIGLNGAVAGLNEDGAMISLQAMPLAADGIAKGETLDYHALLRALVEPSGFSCEVWVEQQAVHPHDGKAGAFRLGRLYEGVLATVTLAGLPYTTVRPPVWKAAFGLRGKDKDAARALAMRWYPGVQLTRRSDDGKADALLIARYGWLQRHGRPE